MTNFYDAHYLLCLISGLILFTIVAGAIGVYLIERDEREDCHE
jgi:hypothetical protein